MPHRFLCNSGFSCNLYCDVWETTFTCQELLAKTNGFSFQESHWIHTLEHTFMHCKCSSCHFHVSGYFSKAIQSERATYKRASLGVVSNLTLKSPKPVKEMLCFHMLSFCVDTSYFVVLLLKCMPFAVDVAVWLPAAVVTYSFTNKLFFRHRFVHERCLEQHV